MRVALGQLNSGGHWERNLSALLTQATVAKYRGAELILFPENALFMGDPKYARKLAPTLAQKALPKIRTAAREWKIAMLLGSLPQVGPSSGKIFNSSLFIDEQGKELARYRKIHLFDVTTPRGARYKESATVAAGKDPILLRWRGFGIGMSVCFDIRFPEMYRNLSARGAECLLIPSAFTYETGRDHWHTLVRSRAIENLAYVFAPAQTGRHPKGRRTFGHSLIVDPWGKILADAGDEPGVTVLDIDMASVAKIRRRFGSALAGKPGKLT